MFQLVSLKMKTINTFKQLIRVKKSRGHCSLCGCLSNQSPKFEYVGKRKYSSEKKSGDIEIQTKMKAWQIYQYGGNEQLTLTSTARIPKITSPSDILVKVLAASVNNIDVRMRGGYGKMALNALRRGPNLMANNSEFPLVLGRDFSGIVVETGQNVKKFKPGDEVWGALSAARQGTHAEFTVTSESEISKKPSTISHTEAASLPYVATTTWSALCTIGQLSESNTHNKRILIHGGSGGIGTFAIQLMKAWNAEVTAICSTDAVDLLYSLGADVVLDYTKQDLKEELGKIKGFDVIYDTLGKRKAGYSYKYLRPWSSSKFISIVHPLLSNLDESGVPFGLLKTGVDAASYVFEGLRTGHHYSWAIFIPNGKALSKIASMVDNGQIKPVVDKVFPFEEIPDAFEKVGQLHGRGKTVISPIN